MGSSTVHAPRFVHKVTAFLARCRVINVQRQRYERVAELQLWQRYLALEVDERIYSDAEELRLVVDLRLAERDRAELVRVGRPRLGERCRHGKGERREDEPGAVQDAAERHVRVIEVPRYLSIHDEVASTQAERSTFNVPRPMRRPIRFIAISFLQKVVKRRRN